MHLCYAGAGRLGVCVWIAIHLRLSYPGALPYVLKMFLCVFLPAIFIEKHIDISNKQNVKK